MRSLDRQRIWLGLALVFALAVWNGLSVEAAKSNVIEKVSVTFKDTYGEPEEIFQPEIKVGSGGGYSLGDVQYRTEFEDWKPGKKVRVEITLNSDSGKYFPTSLTRSQCKVSGADYVSAKALDNTTLQVKADYRPVSVLGTPQKVGWSSSSGKNAVWEKVEYAPGYSLTLYGDDKAVKRMTVDTNRVNLSSYMENEDKTYYYEVKAIPLTSDEKKYLKEGALVSSTDQEFDWDDGNDVTRSASSSKGGGPGDGGSFKGDSYVMPDGTRALNSWKKSGGKWYYFDGNGNRARGWLSWGGKRYYMDQNGVMSTGWVSMDGGRWFYFSQDGDMQTGWIQPAVNNWYYLNPGGDMVRGWVPINGKTYYFDGNGKMVTGWVEPVPGSWYYLNPSGDMAQGWVLVNGQWYYLDASGRMQTGWVSVNGKEYYLRPNGSMVVDTTVDGRTLGADGAVVNY